MSSPPRAPQKVCWGANLGLPNLAVVVDTGLPLETSAPTEALSILRAGVLEAWKMDVERPRTSDTLDSAGVGPGCWGKERSEPAIGLGASIIRKIIPEFRRSVATGTRDMDLARKGQLCTGPLLMEITLLEN